MDNLLMPLCGNCGGSGTDGGSTPDPICKGTGRKALDVDSPASEWVRWIREQPDVKRGEAVLVLFLDTLAPVAPGEDKDHDE